MDKMRQLVKENPDIDANIYMHDGRYNHIMQVQERLNFLRFLLKVIFILLNIFLCILIFSNNALL